MDLSRINLAAEEQRTPLVAYPFDGAALLIPFGVQIAGIRGMALTTSGVVPRPKQGQRLPSANGLPNGLRVLVVEDNTVNQKVVDLMLRDKGFKVDIVTDGKQALAAHRSKPYDLILMDLQMPVMDGWHATSQIRQLPAKQPIIVALTADVIGNIRERCLKAGMDDYLSKPFTKNQLLTVVRGALKRLTAAETIRKAS